MLAVMEMMSPAHRPHLATTAQETPEQEDARRRELATAIVEAAFDPEASPVFRGDNGRSRTAMLIALKFWTEGGFRRDIQSGFNRDAQAKIGLNDHGNSYCLSQINLGRKRYTAQDGSTYYDSATTTQEGWWGSQLLEDPHKCAAATVTLLRQSFGACHALPLEERLAAYARGNCESETGRKISVHRMRALKAFWRQAWPRHPGASDAYILEHWDDEPTQQMLSLVEVQ
jgi:hypothetical protein